MKPLPLNVVEKARDVYDAFVTIKQTEQNLADLYEQVQRVYNENGRRHAELKRRLTRLNHALGLAYGRKLRWRAPNNHRRKWVFTGAFVADDGRVVLRGYRAERPNARVRPIPDEVLYEGEVFAGGKWRPILP